MFKMENRLIISIFITIINVRHNSFIISCNQATSAGNVSTVGSIKFLVLSSDNLAVERLELASADSFRWFGSSLTRLTWIAPSEPLFFSVIDRDQ